MFNATFSNISATSWRPVELIQRSYNKWMEFICLQRLLYSVNGPVCRFLIPPSHSIPIESYLVYKVVRYVTDILTWNKACSECIHTCYTKCLRLWRVTNAIFQNLSISHLFNKKRISKIKNVKETLFYVEASKIVFILNFFVQEKLVYTCIT